MNRWIILAFLLLTGFAVAQTALNPEPTAMVCANNTTPPTATASGFLLVQCNSSGQLVLQ